MGYIRGEDYWEGALIIGKEMERLAQPAGSGAASGGGPSSGQMRMRAYSIYKGDTSYFGIIVVTS